MADIINKIGFPHDVAVVTWLNDSLGWYGIRTNKEIVCTLRTPGAGQYNQWAEVNSTFWVNGSSTSVGRITSDGDDSHRFNNSGLIVDGLADTLYMIKKRQSYSDVASGYEFFVTSLPDYNKWSYNTSSAASYRTNLSVSQINYQLHGQCWSWFQSPWPQVADAYINLGINLHTPTDISSFPIIDDNGKKIKIKAPNSNGLFYGADGAKALDVNSAGEGNLSSTYSGVTVYAIPSYNTSSDSASSTVVAGATITGNYSVDLTPVEYKFTWKSFAPSISRNGRTLTISCSPWPANGFKLYRDGNIVSNNYSSSTYTIPIQYMVGNHTWKVVANPDNYVRDLSYLTRYATYDEDPSKWIAYDYTVSGNAYYTSNEASTSYTINLDTPVITESVRTDIRAWKIAWGSVTNATSYSVKLDDGSWINVSTNLTYTFTGLSQGTHTFYVRANYSSSTYNSDAASTSGTLNIIPQPYNLVFNRGGVNSGTLSWSTQYLDTSDTVYAVYDGSTRIAATNNTSYTLSSLSQGAHVFGVVQEYSPDRDYDSNKTTLSYTMTKLQSPVSIILADIKGNVYQVPGDPSSPVVSSNGKIGIKLTYPTSDTYQGITYKLYNNTFTGVGAEVPDTDGDRETTSSKTMYWNTREPAYGTVGKHRVYPQAVFEEDHNYDSIVVFTKDATTSNPATAYVDYDINTLSSPTLVWNGNNETSRIYESYLTWLPSTAQSENGDYPDYYICYTIADGDIARTPLGNIYTILQPENKTQRVGVWIPDPQPFTDAVYGLIPQMPSAVGTTTYAVCVSSCSYSPWYVGTSTASETTYQIIRLGTPTNILWDVDHWTLSWSPVLNATHYYLYDNGADITPYPDDDNSPRGITGTQYTFDSLGAGLHRFQVSALKITTETVA